MKKLLIIAIIIMTPLSASAGFFGITIGGFSISIGEERSDFESFDHEALEGDKYNVCENLIGSRAVKECISVVQNSEFQHKALHICDENIGADSVISCLRIIADKQYDERALEICHDLIGADSVNSCLETLKSEKL